VMQDGRVGGWQGGRVAGSGAIANAQLMARPLDYAMLVAMTRRRGQEINEREDRGRPAGDWHVVGSVAID
jgi:hypothetical protein